MTQTEKEVRELTFQGSWRKLHIASELYSGGARALALLELERYQAAEKSLESDPGLDSRSLLCSAAAKLELGKKQEAKVLLRSVAVSFESDLELLVALGFAQCPDASTDLDASIQRLGELSKIGSTAHYRFVCFAFGGLPWNRLTRDDLSKTLLFDVSNLYWSAFLYQPLDYAYLEWIKSDVLAIRPGYGLRFCLLALAQDRLDEARALLSKHESDWEVLPTYHQALGHLATRERRFVDARDHYQRSFDLSPGWIRIMADLADAELKVGQYQTAANHILQIATQVNPIEAYEFLGRAVESLVKLGFLALDTRNHVVSTS